MPAVCPPVPPLLPPDWPPWLPPPGIGAPPPLGIPPLELLPEDPPELPLAPPEAPPEDPLDDEPALPPPEEPFDELLDELLLDEPPPDAPLEPELPGGGIEADGIEGVDGVVGVLADGQPAMSGNVTTTEENHLINCQFMSKPPRLSRRVMPKVQARKPR